MCAYGIKYNVNPAYVMAVAHIESRKGSYEFRTGRMGRTYYGPMGIHKYFLNRWNINDPEINIKIGARALSNIQDVGALIRRLHKYNAEYEPSYGNAVKKAVKKYSKLGVSG